jgi:predicted amidophosphoribosyltransferase
MLIRTVELVARHGCVACRGGLTGRARPSRRTEGRAGAGRVPEGLCHRCGWRLRGVQPPAIGGVARTLSAFAYDGAARDLVLGLKLRGNLASASPLVDAMAHLATELGVSASTVTWVPSRRRDVRRRGFDHAEVLGRMVARRLGLSSGALLTRADARPDQAGLGALERWAAAPGAFDAGPCSGAVLLVDDVITTGATAASCAAALRARGAASVEVLSACHRPRRS